MKVFIILLIIYLCNISNIFCAIPVKLKFLQQGVDYLAELFFTDDDGYVKVGYGDHVDVHAECDYIGYTDLSLVGGSHSVMGDVIHTKQLGMDCAIDYYRNSDTDPVDIYDAYYFYDRSVSDYGYSDVNSYAESLAICMEGWLKKSGYTEYSKSTSEHNDDGYYYPNSYDDASFGFRGEHLYGFGVCLGNCEIVQCRVTFEVSTSTTSMANKIKFSMITIIFIVFVELYLYIL